MKRFDLTFETVDSPVPSAGGTAAQQDHCSATFKPSLGCPCLLINQMEGHGLSSRLLPFLSFRQETESRRMNKSVSLCLQCWENGIILCRELADQYESYYDYRNLSKMRVSGPRQTGFRGGRSFVS